MGSNVRLSEYTASSTVVFRVLLRAQPAAYRVRIAFLLNVSQYLSSSIQHDVQFGVNSQSV